MYLLQSTDRMQLALLDLIPMEAQMSLSLSIQVSRLTPRTTSVSEAPRLLQTLFDVAARLHLQAQLQDCPLLEAKRSAFRSKTSMALLHPILALRIQQHHLISLVHFHSTAQVLQ